MNYLDKYDFLNGLSRISKVSTWRKRWGGISSRGGNIDREEAGEQREEWVIHLDYSVEYTYTDRES